MLGLAVAAARTRLGSRLGLAWGRGRDVEQPVEHGREGATLGTGTGPQACVRGRRDADLGHVDNCTTHGDTCRHLSTDVNSLARGPVSSRAGP